MKNILLIILSVFYIIQATSQVAVGSSTGPKPSEKITAANMEKLKQSETLFICRDQDSLALFQEELSKIWTISKSITCIYKKDLPNYDILNEKYSVFLLRIQKTNTGVKQPNSNKGNISGNTPVRSVKYRLNLYLNKKVKKGKKEKNISQKYCSIILEPNFQEMEGLSVMENINYTEGSFVNWKVGFIKNYLKLVNSLLLENKTQDLFIKKLAKPELDNLKNKTLYIESAAFYRPGLKSRLNEQNILKSYGYKYEIIDNDSLSQKIINDKETFYYMTLWRLGTGCGINIYNSTTGEIVLSNIASFSMNIDPSQIKYIDKNIK